VRFVVLFLAVIACEHAGPKAPPPKPDPIKQAHDEFELLPPADAVGTSALYWRGDFSSDGAPNGGNFDEGDFIGRVRTLFGPRDGNTYVLRYKKTGAVITAYCNEDDGPSYGGTPDEAGRDARRAADPILHGSVPPPGTSYRVYVRHEHDALAGPKNAAAIARLDALVSMVPPTDYSETKYEDVEPSVWRVGAMGGHSFRSELSPSEGMAFLLARLKPDAFEPDIEVIDYYLEHQSELPDEDKPKALAALSHFAALSKQVTDADQREQLTEQVAYDTEQLR
jgi:hypothetical protein